ncbi:MAG TPA: ACP S-malonyltransferase, partial [Nocardioidaceae bacterium]|nr:ACP S-malonyltransferase [Nocardioidaceae bacterium]
MTGPTAGGSAIVFPGIGPTAYADMAKFLLVDPDGRELTMVADDVLGYSVIDRYGEADRPYSPAERVAFMLVCLALARRAERVAGTRADVCAGPSFGGLPAAVHAGALTLPDAIRVVEAWTSHVDDYFAVAHSDVVTQSFARLPADRLAEICAELAADGEWSEIACHVDDQFWMLSVRESRLDWLQQRLRAVGGFPLYTMRPPMHSPSFAPLRDTIERELFAGL